MIFILNSVLTNTASMKFVYLLLKGKCNFILSPWSTQIMILKNQTCHADLKLSYSPSVLASHAEYRQYEGSGFSSVGMQLHILCEIGPGQI